MSSLESSTRGYELLDEGLYELSSWESPTRGYELVDEGLYELLGLVH